MYGVVLWSDIAQNCAVIWCEDHRNLAFFKDDHTSERGGRYAAADFNPGDLVEFDIREEDDMRFALDPSVVSPQEYPGLADDLVQAGRPNRCASKTSLPGQEAFGSEILLFPNIAEPDGRESGRKYG